MGIPQFAQFLCEKLDGERGRQTQLAQELQISKSTITAWRNGAKPDFISCLMLAEHFRIPPNRMLEMVGDTTYQMIYRRFMAAKPQDHVWRPISERDLYRDPLHAQVHRELQLLLQTNSEEAVAITTMIRTAVSQVAGAGKPASELPSPGALDVNREVAGNMPEPPERQRKPD